MLPLRWLLFASLLGSVPAAALAQAADSPPEIAGSSIDRLSMMPLEQNLEFARRAVEEVRAAERTLQRIEGTNPECVRSLGALARSLVQVTEAVDEEMRRYLAAGEMERVNAEIRKLIVAQSTARSLVAKATECTGGAGAGAVEAVTTVEYSGGALGGADETRSDSTFEFDVADDPPEASPFM